MKFEYEVFESVSDFLMVASNSFSLGMRQVSTLFLHDGYVVTYSPIIGGEGEESLWLISLDRGTLPLGLIEFDQSTGKIEKILRAVNPEKSHFLVVKPSMSTVLDKALENFKPH